MKKSTTTNKLTATFTEFNNESNWVKGTCGSFTFCAKIYDEASDFGINDGRVSKLSISDAAGQTILNYDRGWDIENDEETNDVFMAVMSLLENSPKRWAE